MVPILPREFIVCAAELTVFVAPVAIPLILGPPPLPEAPEPDANAEPEKEAPSFAKTNLSTTF